jgi:hypothetical protein
MRGRFARSDDTSAVLTQPSSKSVELAAMTHARSAQRHVGSALNDVLARAGYAPSGLLILAFGVSVGGPTVSEMLDWAPPAESPPPVIPAPGASPSDARAKSHAHSPSGARAPNRTRTPHGRGRAPCVGAAPTRTPHPARTPSMCAAPSRTPNVCGAPSRTRAPGHAALVADIARLLQI